MAKNETTKNGFADVAKAFDVTKATRGKKTLADVEAEIAARAEAEEAEA